MCAVMCTVWSKENRPLGLQSHWGIDFSAGWSSITNAPHSTLSRYKSMVMEPPVQIKQDDKSEVKEQWIAYDPQWHTMKSIGGRSGAVIQGGLSYLNVCKTGRVGIGVYALFGYNGARSSSFVYPFAGEVLGFARTRSTEQESNQVVYPGVLSDFSEHSMVSEAKVTVKASTNIEAGVRLGLGQVTDHCFIYVKGGWGVYRVRGTINDMWSPPTDQYFKVTRDPNASNDPMGAIYIQGDEGTGADAAFKSHVYTQGNGTLKDLWPQQMVASSSHARWVNGGIIGIGIDFAPHDHVVIGLSYQAAICANVQFKQWSKTLASGIEVHSRTGKGAGGNPNNQQSWYNMGTAFHKMPSIGIRPLFQSITLNLRYVLPC